MRLGVVNLWLGKESKRLGLSRFTEMMLFDEARYE